MRGKYFRIERGQRFGMLTAVSKLDASGDGHVLWLCACDCGAKIELTSRQIKTKRNQSCGCVLTSRRNGTPALPRDSGEYRSWRSAIQRCENPKCNRYRSYGGRGIQMCEEWRNSFWVFLAHMGPRPVGTTLERLDGDKGYVPGNCVWATPIQQTRNRRSTVKVFWNGEPRPLAEVAERLGISYSAAKSRIASGSLVRVTVTASAPHGLA